MIEALDLTKYYGNRCVVDHVSFKVAPGEVLGFLGPNGAGKSTTMKMLTGFLHPSSGEARIDGVRVSSDAVGTREHLGYLPENGPLYEEMTVAEFIAFIARIRLTDRTPEDRQAACDRVMQTCHIDTVANQTIDTLSKGFRQRVGVAQAILHDPRYLILDEPTDGLDPNQKQEVRQLIRRMSGSKAIILSTHILEEVDAMCNRVIIIAAGKIIADETPEALRRRHPKHNGITLRLSSELDSQTVSASLRSRCPTAKVNCAENAIEVLPANHEPIGLEVLNFAHASQWRIDRFDRPDSRLDEVFRELTAANPVS